MEEQKVPWKKNLLKGFNFWNSIKSQSSSLKIFLLIGMWQKLPYFG
jgi:hypothetical protein